MKRFITKKRILIALTVMLAAVFLFSGTQLILYLADSKKQKDIYTELAQLVVTTPAPSGTPGQSDTPTEPKTDPVTGEPVAPEVQEDLVVVQLPNGVKTMVLRKYAQVYVLNPDMAGWLQIPGTNINYPVMYTPNDPEYYLKRNFYKEKTAAGCLFMQSTCDPFAPSDNVTIYGHHMKDGSMFADLMRYNREPNFWKTHNIITFDTIYEEHTYEIISVFTTSGTAGKGFAFHTFDFAENQEDFDRFVSKCKALSQINIDATAQYGDKLLCLSTCEYSQTNGRLVVVAKQIS